MGKSWILRLQKGFLDCLEPHPLPASLIRLGPPPQLSTQLDTFNVHPALPPQISQCCSTNVYVGPVTAWKSCVLGMQVIIELGQQVAPNQPPNVQGRVVIMADPAYVMALPERWRRDGMYLSDRRRLTPVRLFYPRSQAFTHLMCWLDSHVNGSRVLFTIRASSMHAKIGYVGLARRPQVFLV